MTILRVDIERALADLSSHEGGTKFQTLAAILAKKRWNDLIACERKKDLGADAIAKGPFAAGGIGKVLCCSITPTIGKIRVDAEKVRDHFPGITRIIFATPSAVSNELGEAWVGEIKRDFGFDLAIMSREDIVTSLSDPDNISLLKSYLGIQVDIEPDVADLVQKVREAAAEVNSAWARRITGKPLLELRGLKLDSEGRDSAEIVQLHNLQTRLLLGERIVLEAPAGRGKTTTLIQVAGALERTTSIPFLVDLTTWTSARIGILQFIAGMPQFQRRALDAAVLARVNAIEHFSFMLNGWNEIGEPDFQYAESVLRALERDFPAVGIIVATRNHHVVPPLPGVTRVRLLPLTRRERGSYLKSRLGERSDELRLRLDGDPVLDNLTRTPFFLSEVTSLFEAGASVPSTKIGVLEAVTRLVEQSDEHRNRLQQMPLLGRARDYLGEIAMRITAQGAISAAEEDACPAIAAVGKSFKGANQISALPEPKDVLAALCAHHVLERQDYPAIAFRFEHQQFQEFYATLSIRRQLFELLNEVNVDEERQFVRSYVNQPAWAEPLRLLADHIRGQSAGDNPEIAIRAGTLLVTMALSVDSVFAAELARLCGRKVWMNVHTAIGERLRSLYVSGDINHRNIAIAGILASGSDDFKDILEPLLSGDDQQTTLTAYRGWDEFYLSSLGPRWRETVRAWGEQARVTFVSEILHHRNLPEVTELVLVDPSIAVKQAAIQALSWIGAEEDAARLMESLDERTFDDIAAQFHPDLVPAVLRNRMISSLRTRYATQSDPMARLALLLKRGELGEPALTDELKIDLGNLSGKIESNRAHYVVKPALEIVRATDQPWVDEWLATRIADGSLGHDSWEKMLVAIPEKIKEQVLHRLETEDFKRSYIGNFLDLLTADADAAMAKRIFTRLCHLRQVITAAPDGRHELEHAIERQLETLLRGFPANSSIEGISGAFADPVDAIELDVITRVFSNVARQEPAHLENLADELRDGLRAYIKGAMDVTLQQDDFSGALKANVGSVLASVGLSEDVSDMRKLIQADVERIRRGREARSRGNRGKLGNGGVMGQAPWHVRSLFRIDPINPESVLLDLLRIPEYERDVAGEIARHVLPPPDKDLPFKTVGYERIWAARADVAETTQKERRARYAAGLRNRIEELLDERERCQVDSRRGLEFRLRELGVALAKIDSHGSADLVCSVMSIPDKWHSGPRVEAFQALLFNGVILPTNLTGHLIDPQLDEWRRYGLQQQDEWLFTRFMCLLPFVAEPAEGVKRMREVLSGLRVFGHQLGGILGALGHSRCKQGWEFLLELGSDTARAAQLGDSWINAVAAVDTDEARNVLLSFVESSLPALPTEAHFLKDHAVVARIIELARRDKSVEQRLFRLCAAVLPPTKRDLLAKIVGQLGGLSAVASGLDLIDDSASTPVPFEIWRQLEDAFVERRPQGQSENVFTLEPRNSNAIRTKLLEMSLNDERRKNSASSLLSQIEAWRIEYGRPVGEPRNPAFDSGQSWPPIQPRTIEPSSIQNTAR